MLDIYIPSYKRPNGELIKTLHGANIPFTIVLQTEEDLSDYKKYENSTTKILLLDKHLGIGYARQKIKELYRGIPLVMMDDDAKLVLRDIINPKKLKNIKDEESVRVWFAKLENFCTRNKFDIGGVGRRQFDFCATKKTKSSPSDTIQITIFNSYRCQEISYDPNLYYRLQDLDFILQGMKRNFSFLTDLTILYDSEMNKKLHQKGGNETIYSNRNIMFATSNYFITKHGEDIVIKEPNFHIKLDWAKVKRKYNYE